MQQILTSYCAIFLAASVFFFLRPFVSVSVPARGGGVSVLGAMCDLGCVLPRGKGPATRRVGFATAAGAAGSAARRNGVAAVGAAPAGARRRFFAPIVSFAHGHKNFIAEMGSGKKSRRPCASRVVARACRKPRVKRAREPICHVPCCVAATAAKEAVEMDTQYFF